MTGNFKKLETCDADFLSSCTGYVKLFGNFRVFLKKI
jgi:hypothetical protein